ncbi:MAG: tRNA adenosine(34) deaminase TadA [Nitrospirae bacterium]|jgi:tRNA(adenine34) deaminase|nr:tRNA adenosine(34) deaminase TadA [Nitrospirota bacterium]
MEYNKNDIHFMQIALELSSKAFKKEEVPVGALIVIDNKIIAKAHNFCESTFDPTSHAEIIVIRESCRIIGNWRLTNATLYVTKEPCIMCSGAMINCRLKKLVYGCKDKKAGGVDSLFSLLNDKRLNHQVEIVSGVLEKECAEILSKFFKLRRQK